MIMKAGIMPINIGVISDHRTLFLDISILQLLKGKYIDPLGPPKRILYTTNPKNLKAYQNKLVKHIKDHRIDIKTEKLVQKFEEATTPAELSQDMRIQPN